MTGEKTPTASGVDRVRRGQRAVASKDPEDATVKIVEDLEGVCLEILSRQLDRMFDGADDMLFEMAKRATNNDDQRVFFDTMRAVRLGRPNITQSFADGFVQHFGPDARVEHSEQPSLIDFDELTLQESHAVEETIAVSNMATKAEGLYKNQIWELERRFNYLIRERRAPLSVQALAPATICATFRDSIVPLDVEFAVRIIIYKLFDRLVISDLLELYTAALRYLDSQSIKAPAFTAAPRAVSQPPSSSGMPPQPFDDVVETTPYAGAAGPLNGSAAGPLSGHGGFGGAGGSPEFGATPFAGGEAVAAGLAGGPLAGAAGPAGTVGGPGAFVPGGNGGPAHGVPGGGTMPGGMHESVLDAQTLGSLQNVGGSGAGAQVQYTDSMLAKDLETAARGSTVQGWSVPQAFSYVQRTGMVGRMFNDILADPNLPQTLKPQFDQLRFSVIKNALKDANFFANPAHPVRGIVNELATMAATARATGQESLQRIEDLVTQIRGQFDVAADTVKPNDPEAKSFEDSEVERFIEQQAAQTKSRRQAIISKTRRIVAEELQLRTAGMEIPNSVRPLLNSGWAPMMALHLLRHGPKSDPWNQGLDLLDQILGSLQMLPDIEERRGLDGTLRDSFKLVAMPEERIHELVSGLGEAWSMAELRISERAAEAAALEAARVEQEEKDAAEALLRASSAAEAPTVEVEAEAESHQAEPEGQVEILVQPPPEPADAEAMRVDSTVEPNGRETPAESSSDLGLEASTSAAYDPVSLLDLLVVPGNWFLVYDRQIKSNRWLKAVLRYRDKDLDRGSIAFAEFNGKNTLLVKAQDFLEDLIARRTEPIDLSPAAKHAFDEFLAIQVANGAPRQA